MQEVLEFFQLVFSTIKLRPYVFFYLACALVLSFKSLGGIRTLIFFFLAYIVAFISEYSSTRNGFPYGLYHYIQEPTRNLEIWISNVPFFDSLSYTFLNLYSYLAGIFILGKKRKGVLQYALTSAFLFMMLDVILDPVTNLGDKWFLGKIYYYDKPGIYFGVPLSNFFGWFFVGFITIFLFELLNRVFFKDKIIQIPKYIFILSTIFYLIILVFHVCVTFYIGEFKMGLASLIFTLLIILFLAFSKCLQNVT
jgi:putative membrane protein